MPTADTCSLAEAADYLGISRDLLYRLASQRRIAFYRVTPRGRYRFLRADVEAFRQSMRSEATSSVSVRLAPQETPARRSIAHLLPAVRVFS